MLTTRVRVDDVVEYFGLGQDGFGFYFLYDHRPRSSRSGRAPKLH